MTYVLLLMMACGGDPAPAPTETVPTEVPPPAPAKPVIKHAAMFAPLPEVMNPTPLDPAKVELGRKLYYDTRLSKNDTQSCNSCHLLEQFGVDNLPTSPGADGSPGVRNSPTSYNAAVHFVQFWDGREPTVEAQAGGPITNPVEMGMPSKEATVEKIKGIPGYAPLFAAAYPDAADPITYENISGAIGHFERGLVTPSPFDAYLKGDESALTDEQKKGLDTYVEVGCTTCHLGVGLGGGMYQKLGLIKPYPSQDLGRYEVTKNEADKNMWKVPSLRLITKTGPYLHDGSIATLEEAVQMMGEYQLGRELTDEQVAQIVTFLGALEGQPDAEYIKKPELPI